MSLRDAVLEKRDVSEGLRKRILPIEDYIKSEGITRERIAECVKLGILQVRKHKGKSFIVEGSNEDIGEDFSKQAEPLAHMEIVEGFGKKNVMKEPCFEKIVEPKEAVKAEAGLDVMKDSQRQQKSSEDILLMRGLEDKVPLPDMDLFELEDLIPIEEPLTETDDDSRVDEEAIEIQEYETEGKLSVVVRRIAQLSQYRWQLIGICGFVFGFIMLFYSLWLVMDRGAQFERIDFMNRKIDNLEEQLRTSREELKTEESNLESSHAEVMKAWNELSLVRANFESIQARNKMKVKQLSKQIRELVDGYADGGGQTSQP